jgi:hypothetical protein
MPQYRITASSGRTRELLDHTFVRSDDRTTALQIGRLVIRSRTKGRLIFSAAVYRPELDRAFRGGYIRQEITQ